MLATATEARVFVVRALVQLLELSHVLSRLVDLAGFLFRPLLLLVLFLIGSGELGNRFLWAIAVSNIRENETRGIRVIACGVNYVQGS
jgi:hypothetical protein